MKRKITLLFLAGFSAFTMNSQVVLVENFDATNPPTSNGWTIQNNSVPTGTVDWFQGNPGAFAAYNGLPDDYFAVNYQSVPTSGTGIGDISTWLFTPTITIMNGAELSFAVRGIVTTPQKADRLQLLMSNGNGGFTVPSGTASVGSFTTTLLDINPNLSTSSSTVVSNGIVNGFPQVWTVYTVTLSGIAAPVTGMFAFRSLVPNGGINGTNSRYVGIDAVKYVLPCGPVAQSYTTCAGVTSTLTATGGLAATTYSWSTGSMINTTIVTPTATTVYTLTPRNGTVSCGVIKTVTVTIGTSLSMSITASSATSCAGKQITLTANSSATSYQWNNGPSNSSYVVSPTTSTTYSVGGLAGTCTGGATITINPVANPTLNATFSPTNICPSTTFVATGLGADFYTWVLGPTTSVGGTTVSLIAPSNTLGVTTQFTVVGTSLSGCTGQKVISIIIPPKPVVIAFTSKPEVCTGDTVTWSASGASNYTWTPGGLGSTTNPRTFTAGASASNVNVTVVGIDQGCRSSVTSVFTQTVRARPSLTLSVSSPSICIDEVLTLGAAGAPTFNWTGPVASSANSFTFMPTSAGTLTFTAIGTSTAGCTTTSTIVATAGLCVGIHTNSGLNQVSVFPNPFSNELRINGADAAKVELFNALGQSVTMLIIKEGENINTTSLPNGVYVLKVYSGNGENVKTIKLLKN